VEDILLVRDSEVDNLAEGTPLGHGLGSNPVPHVLYTRPHDRGSDPRDSSRREGGNVGEEEEEDNRIVLKLKNGYESFILE